MTNQRTPHETEELLRRHPDIVPFVEKEVCRPVGATIRDLSEIAEPVAFASELMSCLYDEQSERPRHLRKLREILRYRPSLALRAA
jgi:hypothetical protein